MNKLFNGNSEVELDSIWQDVKNERKPQAAPVKTEENTNNQEDTEEPVSKNTNENEAQEWFTVIGRLPIRAFFTS